MAALRQTVSGGARVAIAALHGPCRRTRPAAMSARPAGTTGWSCGCASRAAGWPARTTPPTVMREPTTRKPTTPSPFGCDPGHGRGGATSITASSEIGARWGAAREPIAGDDGSGTTLGQRSWSVVSVYCPPRHRPVGGVTGWRGTIGGVADGASAAALFRRPGPGAAFRAGRGARAHRSVLAEPAAATPGTRVGGGPAGADHPPRAVDRGGRRLPDRCAAGFGSGRSGGDGRATRRQFDAEPAGGNRRCQLRLDAADSGRGAAAVSRFGDPSGRGRCA